MFLFWSFPCRCSVGSTPLTKGTCLCPILRSCVKSFRVISLYGHRGAMFLQRSIHRFFKILSHIHRFFKELQRILQISNVYLQLCFNLHLSIFYVCRYPSIYLNSIYVYFSLSFKTMVLKIKFL